MMRRCISILAFNMLFSHGIKAQTIRNFGDLEIHTNGQLGIYSSFENDGVFNNSSGLAGFYGSYQNYISGSISPQFHDIEINNDQGVFLQIPLKVNNNTNFIFGDLITSKLSNSNYLELSSTSFYNGESIFSKVNGYVSISNVQSFLFPIGDEEYLRPIGIDTGGIMASFKSTYLFENGTLNFSNKIEANSDLTSISNKEYWILEGDTSAMITIGWNNRSQLQDITNDLNNLTVVGFDKELMQWTNLVAIDRSGNIEEGFISSTSFIPNRYSAITFGILHTKTDILHKGYHYLVTPNGDGINDYLYIPELENYDSNHLHIFSRNGLKVFEQKNYFNEFNGITGVNISAISKDQGLPEGIYFYLVTVGDKNLTLQGFLYLDR
ncbi:gliding motility-associated C-terminal domain-containing protein [Aurantibacter crassamenti]|uniref:gliding motility-associated C-terminal domain-containing protein n=1 Tax=Aurantibacter crassamenti TaxID=1837375 RepID=UPI00193A012C|nr:gliding motility-associated C-terminal domain-containing protein [Aurantibacter crassamenti]MBM1104560.1 gliding motility-associated C-terminal domain-containing protein [Aurantibacter crassamenti]